VHAIVALNEGVAQVVDAELGQALERAKVKVKVVGVPDVVGEGGREEEDASAIKPA